MNPLLTCSTGLITFLALSCAGAAEFADLNPGVPSAWPQSYTVKRDKQSGLLTLATTYYRVDQDLRRGGVISRVRLSYGNAENLLVRPLEAFIRDENGNEYSNRNDAAPRVGHTTEGLTEVVTVDSALVDGQGVAAKGVRLKTRLEYRWGYIKVRQEFVSRGDSVRFTELCAASTTLAPSLTSYGYREGITEETGAQPLSFGSCRWGEIASGKMNPIAIQTNYVPRYVMFAERGREGIEWFQSSNIAQWDLQVAGKRGHAEFLVRKTADPAGVQLKLSPYRGDEPLALTTAVFEYYVGIPLREPFAREPWFHTSFNRNRGDWVATDQVKRWAQSGIQTVHCHNDGDYYSDGLFWRDGSYPPYPDMGRYDKVIADCHATGIRVATYFSNKELHPDTPEFQASGAEWARRNLKGELAHNFYRGTNEFGAQMCLRSGWLPFLKFSIDRVLKNHRLDGVYYDWNVALLCYGRHEHPETGAQKGMTAETPHWDIDELMDLMEWTRQRVGPKGLVIVHNTTTPMFAAENFADYVVANEWGYGKWAGKGPKLEELPLEWSLVGARSRGVISYGQLDAKSPPRLKRVFALEALVSGVAPWPLSEEAQELFKVLDPIGEVGTCRFADWRNDAVTLRGERCGSAIYSRPGEAYVVLANLEENAREIECALEPRNLPHPFAPGAAAVIKSGIESAIDVRALTKGGVKVSIPGDSAVLLRVGK